MAPLPAFVAVPNTSHSFIDQAPNAPSEVVAVRQGNSAPSNSTGNQERAINTAVSVANQTGNTGLTRENGPRVSIDIGTQNAVPLSGEETEDSDAGFGYASVRRHTPPKDRPLNSPPNNGHKAGPGRPLPEVPASVKPESEELRQHSADIDSPLIASGIMHQPNNTTRDLSFSPGRAVPLYAKVNKPKSKLSPQKAGTNVALPPRAPSPLTKVDGKGGAAPNTRTEMKIRTTYYPGRRSGEGGSQKPAGQGKRVAIAGYHSDNSPAPGEREKHVGYLSWDGAERAEYDDGEYIPTGDDTFSITETDSDEALILQSLHSKTSPRDSREEKLRTYYGPGYHRSLTPDVAGTVARESLSPRPNSAPLDNIPFIRPSFIQNVTPTHPRSTDREVYIFSEKQADGSVQYYTATPVRSPLLTNHTHFRSPVTPPLIQQPATPSPMVPSHAHSTVSPRKLLESGYYSTLNPTSPRYHQSSMSFGRGSAQGQAAGATITSCTGTKITKLGSPVRDLGSHGTDGASFPLRVGLTQPDISAGGLPIAGVSIGSDRLKSRDGTPSSKRDEFDIAASAGLPVAGLGVDMDARLRQHTERRGFDQADSGIMAAGVPLAGIADQNPNDLKWRERIRSLTAESVALGQQVAREQKQRKINEVSG